MNKMIPGAFSLMIFILCFFLLISCQKEYSCEGGLSNCSISGGTAVFTSTGAGGACDNPISSGQFYTGVSLTSANKVQINIEVTTVGTYAITTNSADGFQFTGTGNFTDTGRQTITLKGSGTPSKEGSFSFRTGYRAGVYL